MVMELQPLAAETIRPPLAPVPRTHPVERLMCRIFHRVYRVPLRRQRDPWTCHCGHPAYPEDRYCSQCGMEVRA